MKIVLIVVIIYLSSCYSRNIIGNITEIKGKTIVIDSAFRFKVDTAGLYVGKEVTFKPTVNRSKINSKRIKIK